MAVVARMIQSDDVHTVNALDELREIVRTRSFRAGHFVLSSGKESNLYFNMKPTMMLPRGAELASRAFIGIAKKANAEYLGGLEMGAVPVIGSIAAISSVEREPIKTFFVRKHAKMHGTMDLIEGLGLDESLEKKQVLVVDDVATSGKSILQAIDAVRAMGGIVEQAACLVNREEGADEFLLQHGVRLTSVLRGREFLGA